MKKRFAAAMRTALALVLIIATLLPSGLGTLAADTGWTISGAPQIFWAKTADSEKSYEALTKQVKLFSSELAEKVTGTALPISYGEQAKAGTNDIILVLDSTLGIAKQGYTVAVNGTSITISASDADGLFYGCRYLIKQLLLNGSVESTDKVENPDVLERAVSLDNGRKYYSVDWIKAFIREMSWANMNALALHFSEEMGLGIESKLYPWLNGRDGTLCTQAELVDSEHEKFDAYLTQEEVKEIVEYAKLYHVEIIPSLDSPGHMNYIVKKFNEQCAKEDFSFTYDGETYTAEAGSEIGNYFSYNGTTTAVVPGSRNTAYSRGIDISNEVAVAFTQSLIKEYATLFRELGCTKFDIGGDELLGWGAAAVSGVAKWKQLDHWKAYAIERTGNSNAVAYDAFLLYMNDLNALVRELGYTSVRMWNDDALRAGDTGWSIEEGVVQLDTDIDIWFWTTGSNTFADYASAGYQLYNILSDYNYYAMTEGYFSTNRGSFTQAYADQIYNEWTPFIFYPDDLTAGWPKNAGTTNDNILGGAFGIWCDNPTLRTEEEVMTEVLPLIRANAAKSWDALANETVDYKTYTANWAKFDSAPAGTVPAPDVDVYRELDTNALEGAVAAFGKVNAEAYTEESYGAYKKAVDDAWALAEADGTEQAELDAAVAKITEMVNYLRYVDTLDDTFKISSLRSRSTRVVKGKYVTLTLVANRMVDSVEVYDDLGNRVSLRACAVARNSTATKCTVTLQFAENTRGTRTYTVYAVDAAGNCTKDPKTCKVLCY